MKLSSIVCASVVALAGCALAIDGAFAAAKVVSHSNTNNNKLGPNTGLACPTGEVVYTNPTTGKQSCVKSDMAVKGSGVPKNTTTTAPGSQKTWDSSSPKQ
jgi:hypothetical protein